MKLTNVSDGSYDKDLNKTTLDLGDIRYHGMQYIVHKGRRYEIEFTNMNLGSISLKDVTESGMERGQIIELTIHGIWNDSTKLMNSIYRIYRDGNMLISGMVKLLEKLSKGARGEFNSDTVTLNENEFKTNVSVKDSSSYFSLMGLYEPIRNRPKEWTRALVIRGLMNFQLQEVSRLYNFDNGQDNSKTPLNMKNTTDFASDINIDTNAYASWKDGNIDSNFVNVVFYPDESYFLKIIDPKIRV